MTDEKPFADAMLAALQNDLKTFEPKFKITDAHAEINSIFDCLHVELLQDEAPAKTVFKNKQGQDVVRVTGGGASLSYTFFRTAAKSVPDHLTKFHDYVHNDYLPRQQAFRNSPLNQ